MSDVMSYELSVFQEALRLLDRKQKSRVWFGPEVDLLNDICQAKEILLRIIGEINVEKAKVHES